MTNGVQNLLKIALDAMFEFHRLHYTTRCMHAPLPARYAPDYPDTTKTSLSIFTRAQYAPGLCVCVRLYVCVCVCVCIYVCRQKTRLFTSHRSKFATKTHFAACLLNL